MKFYLVDEIRRNNALEFIQNMPIDKNKVVVIGDAKKHRSLLQNSLWHKWVQILGDEAGYTFEEMKVALKREFFGMIELRDPLTGGITYKDI